MPGIRGPGLGPGTPAQVWGPGPGPGARARGLGPGAGARARGPGSGARPRCPADLEADGLYWLRSQTREKSTTQVDELHLTQKQAASAAQIDDMQKQVFAFAHNPAPALKDRSKVRLQR